MVVPSSLLLSPPLRRQRLDGPRHPPGGNVPGVTDEDGWPWLRRIAAWLDERSVEGRNSAVACAILRPSHRDLLRESRSDVRLCELLAPEQFTADRQARAGGTTYPRRSWPVSCATLGPLRPEVRQVVVSVTVSKGIVEDALRQLGLMNEEVTI